MNNILEITYGKLYRTYGKRKVDKITKELCKGNKHFTILTVLNKLRDENY